jgi:hypothetical protein
MRGLIQYTTPFDVPAISPYDMRGPYPPGVSPWQSVITAGQLQSIYMPFYKLLRKKPIASGSLSKSRTGIFQGQFVGLYYRHRISVTEIKEVRKTGIVNLYDIYEKLNEACARHVPIAWFKDTDLFPAEFVYCMVEKVLEPKRVGSTTEWTFTFELLQMSDVQIPAVPAFVPV